MSDLKSDVQLDGVQAVRVRLSEDLEIPTGLENWTTTAHFLRRDEEGWVWVDLESTSSDVFRKRPDRIAPGLIGLLLDDAGADLGLNPLRPKPRKLAEADAQSLVDWLGAPDREVPIVVFSVDTQLSGPEYSSRIQETARRLAGCVDVHFLLPRSQDVFNRLTAPKGLDVHSGAARIYLPGLDFDAPKVWRHRYVRSHVLSEYPQRAANQIGRLLLDRSVARRPPPLFTRELRSLLDGASGQATDWQALAEDAEQRLEEVLAENEQLKAQSEEAWLNATISESAANKSDARLRRLQAIVRERGLDADALESDSGFELADLEFLECADAVEAARKLPGLVIPKSAERELERIDALPNSELMAQRIYRHLVALSAYAEEKGPGFVTWCKTSASEYKISPDHVAMSESDAVSDNKRYRDARIFAVARDVDQTGSIYMEAHTKPIEGGSMQVPRIYFHDDTKLRTGRIHIGFIGPHDLVPNTKSD